MTNLKLVILSLISLFFLTTPVGAEEISCPDGGAPLGIQYGDVVNCSIENVGDLDVYAISATEGDFISANVVYTGEDDCDLLQLTLRGIDTESTEITKGTAAKCSGTRIEFKAAKAGIHSISISDFFNKTAGDYQVEFTCLSGPCITQALLPKQECTATFDGSELKVPHLEFDSKIYWVDFKLISSDPIQVQVTKVGEK